MRSSRFKGRSNALAPKTWHRLQPVLATREGSGLCCHRACRHLAPQRNAAMHPIKPSSIAAGSGTSGPMSASQASIFPSGLLPYPTMNRPSGERAVASRSNHPAGIETPYSFTSTSCRSRMPFTGSHRKASPSEPFWPLLMPTIRAPLADTPRAWLRVPVARCATDAGGQRADGTARAANGRCHPRWRARDIARIATGVETWFWMQ